MPGSPFIRLLADRTPIAELPAWIFTYGKLGLVEVCGHAATDVAAIAQACAALPDASPRTAPAGLNAQPRHDRAGAPRHRRAQSRHARAHRGGGTCRRPGDGERPFERDHARAEFRNRRDRLSKRPRRNSRLASYALAAVLVAAATLGALARPASILDVATWAFVLAAAGLFPALFAALWWKRANAYGAAAAMLAGLAVALIYLIGARYFAVPFFEATSACRAPARRDKKSSPS